MFIAYYILEGFMEDCFYHRCFVYFVGLLSDLLLSNIAGQLGAEWQLVILGLGVAQNVIEQIQEENIGFVHRQITKSLIR